HGCAALFVGFLDRLLDGGDGLVPRENAADREEARLHDRVDPLAHAGLARHAVPVDHEETQPLFDQLLLHYAGEVTPGFFRRVRAIEQEGCARLRGPEYVKALQERELVAGHEIGPTDEVRRMNWLRAEAQVRNGDRTRLLRIVD